MAIDTRAFDELRASVGGDDEFLTEIVDDFLVNAPELLAALRLALSSGDAAEARRAAHTLKGTSRTFGAGGLAELCQEVEAAAAAGELQAALARVDGLAAEWSRVESELVALRGDPV